MAKVAHALGRADVLTDAMVRQALGPHMLAWLKQTATEQHEELAA